MKLTRKTKGRILQGFALGLDVGAPLIATLTQFPAWIERSAESTVSGLFVVFALLSAIPLFKHFKEIFKSPSITLLWGIALALFIALRNIIDEMIIICLVGVISNFLGGYVYRKGKTLTDKETKDEEDRI